jgi:predicted RNase H-like HicB family nuclease
MKVKYPAILYHYADAITNIFPNLEGCVSQTEDGVKPTLEHAFKLAKEALEGYLKGEDLDALPKPYTIKEAAQFIEDQDVAEPYHAVSIVEVEVDL